MSERYTRLYALPENLHTDDAPILIAAGALLKDTKKDNVLAQLKLRNLRNRRFNPPVWKVWYNKRTGGE